MARRAPQAQAPSGDSRTVKVEAAAASAVTPRTRSVPADWLPLALIVGDAIIGGASVPVAYWIRFGRASQVLPIKPYLVAIPMVVAIYLVSLAINRQYNSWRGEQLAVQLVSLYSGVGLAAILMLAAIELFNLGASYSRLTFVPAVLIAVVLMTGERYVLRQYETRLRRHGIGTERVLMVGTGAGSELLIRRMSMFPQYGFQVVGVASDDLSPDETYVGVPVLGRVDDMPTLVEKLNIEQVFLALPAAQRDHLLRLIKMCEDQNLEFRIVPDLLEVMSTRAASTTLDGLPLVGIRHSQLTGRPAMLKRAIDVAVSAVALIVLSPVLIVIVILMKVTMPGPILFRQERVGRQGRAFVIYKFRSMIPDAEARTGPVVAKPGDDRVTWFGRLMRKLSLDELPQFINVLRGDMSLVGPRPQPKFFDERYGGEVPRYLERQQVRPGLTGWAEVNDLRGAAPIGERTMYDVYYIENWTLALDLKIVILTGLRMFSQRHAY